MYPSVRTHASRSAGDPGSGGGIDLPVLHQRRQLRHLRGGQAQAGDGGLTLVRVLRPEAEEVLGQRRLVATQLRGVVAQVRGGPTIDQRRRVLRRQLVLADEAFGTWDWHLG